MSEIYTRLEEVIEIDENERTYFGSYISSGEFSIVYKMDYPFVPQNIRDKFNSPVLIITSDQGKMEILSYLIDSNFYEPDFEKLQKESLDNWLYENDYSTIEEAEEDCEYFDWNTYVNEFDIYPLLRNISEELGLNVFFMEKAEEVSYTPFIFEKIENLFFDYVFSGNMHANSGYFIEQLNQFKFEKELVSELKESLNNEYLDFIKLFKIIKRDIIKACNTRVLSTAHLSLDLHSKQFIEIDNKVYLSDAFVY